MGFNNFYQRRIYLAFEVICDLDVQFSLITKTGMTAKNFREFHSEEELQEEIKKYGKKYYSTAPWVKDSELLYNYLKKYRPIIISNVEDNEGQIGIEMWVRNSLQNHTEVIFIKEKESQASSDSILIDSDGVSVRKFIIANGSGIEHNDVFSTIKILKEKYGM